MERYVRSLRAKQDAITNDPVVRRIAEEAVYQKNSPLLHAAQSLYDTRRSMKQKYTEQYPSKSR